MNRKGSNQRSIVNNKRLYKSHIALRKLACICIFLSVKLLRFIIIRSSCSLIIRWQCFHTPAAFCTLLLSSVSVMFHDRRIFWAYTESFTPLDNGRVCTTCNCCRQWRGRQHHDSRKTLPLHPAMHLSGCFRCCAYQRYCTNMDHLTVSNTASALVGAQVVGKSFADSNI